MAMREWYLNITDSDRSRTLWQNLCGIILLGCVFLLSFGLLILVGYVLSILFETTPNSSGKAGNLTMSIHEFASKDDLSSVKFL